MAVMSSQIANTETENAWQHAACSIRLAEQPNSRSMAEPRVIPPNACVSVYSRFTNLEKVLITILLGLCGFVGTMSTTGVLAAVPELVDTFDTTTTVVTSSNALYLLFMGLSSCIWGPASEVFGRKKTYLCSLALFCGFSLGTALAPDLASFLVFRALTATQGTAFLILGSAGICDIYEPIERATSLAWFLSGSMSGYAFGPVLGGSVVTYTSWRVIFYLQTGMSGAILLVMFLLLKETLHTTRSAQLNGHGFRSSARKLWKWGNPTVTFKLIQNRSLLFPILASSALVWNMYSLLTPIRYVLNPRLHLTTPLQSGMLFLSPGAGYLIGVQIGGRWADRTAKRWMKKRGHRRPEDRLRSCLPFHCVVLPGAMTLYGWMVDKSIGGVPVPVVCMFFQGLGQTASFVSLNAYILDVMQHRSGEASAAHYLLRFVIGAISTAVCVPLINSIGVGWTSVISAALALITGGLVIILLREDHDHAT
ncbi:hypothetical protein FOVSG1_006534 [Fusarium oxysporum f. sp. vasinfectum]